MAIDKPLGPGNDLPGGGVPQGLGSDLTSPVMLEAGEESSEFIPLEDGSGIVDFGSSGTEDEDAEEEGFNDNLAEYIDQGELDSIGSKIVELVDIDDRSRADWKRAYIKGLDLLGFKTEDRTDPWAGACGVFHPVMTEAVVRFQSQAIMEIFPSSGPVKTKIIGKWSKEKEKQAKRVQQELNYFICDKMTEFRPETETLLFYLALAGSAFRKIYYCPELKRPVGRFIPAEDFIVPYGTTDLRTCPRYTQIMRMFPNDLRKQQAAGMYLDLDLPEPEQQQSDIKEKYDKIQGRARTPEIDERYTLLECHMDLDLPGYEDGESKINEDTGEEEIECSGIELPYVVTVDKSSGKVLSIYRNWEEADESKIRRQHFTPYHYLPGLGFYGTGLIHLIGGITASATSIMRQLVDAGTLANLPGGLKSRGMRIKGDDSPIMPGEFRDVDVPSGNIRDNITFLPYKEPSATLHALLNDLIGEGRRLGAAPDLPINAMTQQAPVGTTLALLERSMKVMSAVQARLHASLKADFQLIGDIIVKDMGPEYEYEVPEPESDRVEDFDQVDIIPVSDPNASSMAQRVVQYQSALELAKQYPTMYDLPELNRQMLTILGIQNVDKVVKDPDNTTPMDPVSENMAMIMGKPVKAFLWQDQEAHIQAHMSAAKDPKILEMVGQSPQASLIQGAMSAHIAEHLAYAYRKGIEEQMGVPLPAEGEQLPEDVEVQLSKVVAEAGKRLLQKDTAEAAQKKAEQMAQDPVMQLQMADQKTKEAEVQRKAQADKLRSTVDVARLMQKDAMEKLKLASQEKIAGAALGVKIAESHAVTEEERKDRAVDAAFEILDLEQRGRELLARQEQARRQGRPRNRDGNKNNGSAQH